MIPKDKYSAKDEDKQPLVENDEVSPQQEESENQPAGTEAEGETEKVDENLEIIENEEIIESEENVSKNFIYIVKIGMIIYLNM